MPLVDDYDRHEDDEALGGRGGGAAGGGVTAPLATPQREESFTPWSRFVSANQEVSQREAGKLAGGVEAQAKDVTARRDTALGKQEDAVSSNYERPILGGPSFGAIAPQQKTQQTAGNWSSFGMPQGEPAPKPAAPTQQSAVHAGVSRPQQPGPQLAAAMPQQTTAPMGQPRRVDPNKLKTDVSSGAPKTSGFGLSGWDNLESQLGAPAWASLVGDTQRAQGQASALGSEAGVEGLLRKQTMAPNSAFDAALISGEGGQRFRDISKKYGDDTLTKGLAGANEAAQKQWAQLSGDVGAAGDARDAEIRAATDEMNRLSFEQSEADRLAPSAPPTGTQNPWGYTSYNDMLAAGGLGTDIRDAAHSFVNDTSLSNAAVDEAGKAGVYQGSNVAEEFRKGIGLGDDLDMQNIRGTFRDITDTYGWEAASWLFDNLTAEEWASLNGKNAGAIFRILQQALEAGIASGAFKQPAAGTVGGKKSDVKPTGYTTGDADAGTTDEQETARQNAYREGWGSEWDRQFREGNQNPERGS